MGVEAAREWSALWEWWEWLRVDGLAGSVGSRPHSAMLYAVVGVECLPGSPRERLDVDRLSASRVLGSRAEYEVLYSTLLYSVDRVRSIYSVDRVEY